MRIVGRVLLSPWILVLCGLTFVLQLSAEHPRTMERKAGERHGIIGVARDAHTRVVAAGAVPQRVETTTTARVGGLTQASTVSVQAEAHAAFQVIDFSSQPLSAEAKGAFQHAVDIWAGLVNSAVPIRIVVGWGANPGFLAHGTAPIYRNFPNAPLPDVWYSKPLADALAGVDVQPGSGGEIQINFDSTANWYYGTDGRAPAGTYDFVTVALHEITHHLGFVPLMWGDNGQGIWGVMNAPAVYSRYLVNGAGQSLLNTSLFPNPSAALGAQLASNNIFWAGPTAIAALGGTRPKIYTPTPWTNGYGASLNHLDEASYPPGNPNSLMTPMLNTAEAIHVPGPATMGMLADMGWVQDSTCSYTLDKTDVLIARTGITGAVVNVSAPATCQWAAVSNDPGFITVTAGATSNGPSPVTFNVSANAAPYRTGSITIAGQTFTVRQNGSAPTMTVDKTALNFGAASLGAIFSAQTSAQIVRLRQSGLPGTVTWTAQSTQPWLQVSPTSGTGSADLSISVVPSAGVPLSGSVSGAIQLTFTGAGSLAGPIPVTLTTVQNGLTTPPIGVVDTPADMQNGVTGAVAMTGWALDDLEIDRVAICRLPFPQFEAPGPNPHCGGRADVFVGFAVRIDGARPDVQAAYPGFPLNTRGGWGFMILTNMLPLEGNSTYTFLAWAYDREGSATRLGVRTILCENSSATKPFGAIDTPEQGGTASGSNYVNFGWALTQFPKTIPIDGSTITVLVDGSPVGNASYNHYRPDIAGLFPGRRNSDGAVGFRIIDTTLLENGVHTISWVVTDDQGATEGIGSRFFTVSNGAGALTAANGSAVTAQARSLAALPTPRGAVLGRRGFDLSAPWTSYAAGRDGRAVIRGEELDRFELALGGRPGERHTGFLRVGDTLAPLPAGSQLDPSTGAFTWAPGVGFVGTYDLVFLRARQERVLARQDVRIVLHPGGSGRVGTQIAIDVPRAQQDVAQPFAIGGWAADLSTTDGTGIDNVQVWAYPLAGGPPVFVGAASYGAPRPDVAAVHGERFRDSGFGLVVQGLPQGSYDLAVFAWSTGKGDFAPAKAVRLTVR